MSKELIAIRKEVIETALNKDPEIPSLTLAKMLFKAHDCFSSVEQTRRLVRYRRGESGNKNRKAAKIVSPAEKRQVNTPIGNIVPPSDDAPEKVEPVNLKLEGHGTILSDIHFPYHDEDALKGALEHSEKIGATDWILLNGDIMDFYQGSSFCSNPNTRDLAGELEMVGAFLKDLTKHYKRVIFKLGNHERRWMAYLFAKAPEIANLPCLTFESLFKAFEIGIEMVQPQQIMLVGKHLTILHGHEFGRSFFNPVNAARGAYLKAKDSCIVGHLHQSSEHTASDIRGRIVSCWSLGTLCDLKPPYAPINNWNHGFATMLVEKNDFEVVNHRIIKGKVR
jgi:predicted phosphodiesterase